MRRKLRKIKGFILRNWFWIVLGLILTKKAVEYSYQDRGYMAIGGEYLVLPVLLMTVYMVRCFIQFIAEIIDEEVEERASRTRRNRNRVQRKRGDYPGRGSRGHSELLLSKDGRCRH